MQVSIKKKAVRLALFSHISLHCLLQVGCRCPGKVARVILKDGGGGGGGGGGRLRGTDRQTAHIARKRKQGEKSVPADRDVP